MSSSSMGSGGSQPRRGLRVVLSIRVSMVGDRKVRTDGGTFISPEVQLDQLSRLVQREGFQVVPSAELGLGDGSGGIGDYAVVELDKTGRTSNKRQVGAMIQAVQEDKIDGIAVWKVDRWGRNLLDSLLNIKELRGAGGFIASATENLDEIDTPSGKISLTMALLFAEMKSDDVAKTWKDINAYRLSQGKTLDNRPRFGYLRRQDAAPAQIEAYRAQLAERTPELLAHVERAEIDHWANADFIPDPLTSIWLINAYRWYVGGVPIREISRRINAGGIRHTSGAEFQYTSLRRVLRSGFAAGLVVQYPDGEAHPAVYWPGEHEPIIARELLDDLLVRLSTRREEGRRNKHAQYRCSKLVYCPCGRRHYPRKRKYRGGNSTVQWTCSGIDTRGRDRPACRRPTFASQDVLEALVREWLKERATGTQEALDAATARARRAIQAERDADQIDREILRIRKRLASAVELVADGTIDRDAFKLSQKDMLAKIARMEEDARTARTEMKVNSIPDQEVFQALLDAWDLLDPAAFNEGLSKAIRKIIVQPGGGRSRRPQIQIVGRWEPDPQAVQRAS